MNNVMIFAAEYLFVASPLVIMWMFYKAPGEQRRAIFTFASLLLPLALLLGIGARALYNDPRPFVVGNFTPLIVHAGDNGFPSDHTLLLATLATLVFFFDPTRRYALALWIITLIVGYARVYVGVHHFVDIGASIIIALLSGFIVESVLKRYGRV